LKISRRTVLIIALALAPFLLIGFTFPAFVQDNFITPIALVLWLFWRILQSVDQQVFWIGLIFAVTIYGLIRLYRWAGGEDAFEQTQSRDSNAALEQISYWRTSIHLTDFQIDRSNILARSLAKTLAAAYASKQLHVTQYQIYSALEQREMPLPEPVYTFLFPPQSSGAKHSLTQLLRNLRDMPRKRIHRWTGREKAEYYQVLDQTLSFIESVMEKEDADKRFDAHLN
jgi:hypothetical protein